jgi:hypothetical protein
VSSKIKTPPPVCLGNMKYIHATLEKQFIFALKSNRLIALNKEDKANGRYTRIDSIQWSMLVFDFMLL